MPFDDAFDAVLADVRRLHRVERRLEHEKRQLKGALLNGRHVEDGPLVAVLELLPGRNPQSRNPDDYEVRIGRKT